SVERTHRGNLLVHTQAHERVVVTRLENHTVPLEVRLLACLPTSTGDDRRFGAPVEAILREVPHRAVRGQIATAETLVLVKGDLCGGLRGENDTRYAKQGLQLHSHGCLRSIISRPHAEILALPLRD